jgi:hypothetical protein
MNRMYFGDTRDLFKYDLVRHIMKSLPELGCFTFVPMLTENDEKSRSRKSAKTDMDKAFKAGKAGSQNRDLVKNLERLQEIENDLEYFSGIQAYFQKEHILIDILDRPRFAHTTREQYFQNLFDNFPSRSLIFLDPDTGLEESKPTHKHLLLTEVKKIHDQMDPGSIMMIYQHFPREKHDGYVRQRCRQLCELTGSNPITITDNEIVFFLMVKNDKLRANLEQVLEIYANCYPALDSCVCM